MLKFTDLGLEFIVSDFFDSTRGLFSRDYEPLVLGAIKNTLKHDSSGDVLCTYPEFPLIGDSWLDFTVGFGKGFAHEYDLSKRGLEDPTLVNFHSYKVGNEEDFLEPIGGMAFADSVSNLMKRASGDFRLSYGGLFKGRGTDCLRIALYYRGDMDPDSFFSSLESIGFNHLTDEMKEILSPLIRYDFSLLELSLNLKPDGNLDENIGIIFNVESLCRKFSGYSIRLFKESRYEDFLRDLYEKGLIDERWKIARDSIYMKQYHSKALEDIDGARVINGFRGVKLSWEDGKMQPAKMYMDFGLRK